MSVNTNAIEKSRFGRVVVRVVVVNKMKQIIFSSYNQQLLQQLPEQSAHISYSLFRFMV